jgi:signal transduction histidine kinase
VHKDKEEKNLYFEITAYPLKDPNGQVARIIHLSRDVTDRRLAEEALKENSEKTKLFAYSVAHDLKSPAIGIHGLTQRLHDHYAESLDEKGKNYCLQVLKASEQLIALTENINAYISEKETPPIFENFTLKEILEAVKEEFAAQLDSRHIRWSEPDHDHEISADKLSITRMLRNLVDNALKYGGNGLSEITVGHKVSDKFHTISVTDDGVGIGNDEFGKIFDPFERNYVSKGIEGTGLGLAIVKEIANQHKGKVWSKPGREKGTTFCVTISKELGAVKSSGKEKPGNHNAIT